MRTLFILTIIALFSASCATGPGMAARRSEKAEETRKAVEQVILSGNYLIKMDRLDSPGMGSLYLSPSVNFILMDKGIIQMRLGYAGRQFDFRGIAAINLRAKPSQYEIKRDDAKGIYDIRFKVSQGGEPFDVTLSVTGSGQCYAYVTNPRIQSSRYSGRVFLK